MWKNEKEKNFSPVIFLQVKEGGDLRIENVKFVIGNVNGKNNGLIQ